MGLNYETYYIAVNYIVFDKRGWLIKEKKI